jgi:hypothetical protein
MPQIGDGDTIADTSRLVFVRLAYNRRFVGAINFFVLILFVFIWISRRRRVAHNREAAAVYPARKFRWDAWRHVIAPRK